MNFEVDEWSPTPRQGPMGRMMPPGPKPTAEEDQTMIYIVLPALTPPQQMMGMNPAEQQIGQALQEHLAAGQPALAFIHSSPMGFGGGTNTIADQLKPFGIEPDMGRMIFTSVVVDRTGRTRSIPQAIIKDWPEDTAMGRACTGLTGMVAGGVSLKLTDKSEEDVETWPIIETDDLTWSAMAFGPMEDLKQQEDDPKGPFVVGAAAQRAQQRLVVIASPLWATDQVTELGERNIIGQLLYTYFPANAELFTNSVYWLAKDPFESLIATSAYTQDVARIGEISRPANVAAWWLLLILPPALTLGAGAVVWLFRRR
jgi:hypothetical protein